MTEAASEDAPRGKTPRAPLPEDVFAPPGSPCERLQEILGVLLAAGNVPNTNGFLRRPDGPVLELVHPIDFVLIRATCDVPPNVVLSEEYDTSLDRLKWASIEGPGALAAMRLVARDAGRPWPTTSELQAGHTEHVARAVQDDPNAGPGKNPLGHWFETEG